MNAIGETTKKSVCYNPPSDCSLIASTDATLENPKYQKFTDASLWCWNGNTASESLQRHLFEENMLGSQTLAAYAYAEIIFKQNLSMADTPGIANEPLYIFELEPQSGCFAWHCLTRLQALKQEHNRESLRIIYLLVSGQYDNPSFSADQHPRLQFFLQQGMLDFISFDPACGIPEWSKLKIRGEYLHFKSIKNLPVVIATNYLSRQKSDLLCIHYGKLFEAFICFETHRPREAGNTDLLSESSYRKMHCEWQPKQTDAYPYDFLNQILAGYIETFNSSVLLYPVAALVSIDWLRYAFGGQLLILSRDFGICHERDLVMHSEETLLDSNYNLLPLNYHALAKYASLHQGQVWQTQCEDRGIVTSVLLFTAPGKPHVPETALQHNPFPDQFRLLRQLIQDSLDSMSSDQMLTCLQLTKWDMGLFDLLMPRLASEVSFFTPDERLQWIAALEQLMQHYYPEYNKPDYAFDIGFIATRLSAWSFAIDCYQESLRWCGDEIICLTNLAYCYWNIGSNIKAFAALDRAADLNKNHARVLELTRQIRDWEDYCNRLEWYSSHYCYDDEITLQPLGEQHAEAFFIQYRDPGIAELTCLPYLETLEAVHQWIVAENNRRHPLFAIIHRKYGFAGCVSLLQAETAAFFYFWVGVDYQGGGIGRKAAAILFKLAERQLHLQQIFTSSYNCNKKSERALAWLGFNRMPFEAEAPDQDMSFWMLSLHISQTDSCNQHAAVLHQNLKQLLEACDSPIRLAACPVDCGYSI